LTSKTDRSTQPREEKPNPTTAKGGVCPFVANPMPDCHCAQMTSLRIPHILKTARSIAGSSTSRSRKSRT